MFAITLLYATAMAKDRGCGKPRKPRAARSGSGSQVTDAADVVKEASENFVEQQAQAWREVAPVGR